MSELGFGTDHERYLGSGIVFLSQIRETSPDDCSVCKRRQKEIESQFQRGACKSWTPEFHLKAEILQSQWETREILEQTRLERYDLPRLWFQDADIRIVEKESVARYEAAKSSSAPELRNMFRRLETEERWWVVDFFTHVDTDDRQTALNWEQEAVRNFFSLPSREWGEEFSTRKSLLKKTPYAEARRVSRTRGVGDAFRALSRLPILWNTATFTYLADVRKSFCNEEAENYIWAMVGQWKEITLNWTSSVVQCVDFKSIEMLQSRAPSWSKKDLKSVRKGFRLRQIFPLLEDAALRDQVESAVCSQGPILTLETFAQDARLLQLRVRGSLSKLVLGLRTENEDTLRTRTCDLLSKEVDQVSLELGLPNPSGAERHALIKRCYQHIFLHAIRTRAFITRIHLSAVVEQELVSVHVHEREFAPQNQLTEKDVIATRAPADNLPDVEVDDRRRHGHLLFKHATATKHLYCDRINDSHVPSLTLTQSSMAKHIVRVFLFGRAAFEPTQMLTPGLPTSIAQSASTVAQSTPFDISPITTCASSSIHSLESPVWTATPPIRDVRRGRAETSIAMVKSIAASLFDTELLPASSSPTSNRATMKRSASVAMLDPPQQDSTGGSRLTKWPRRQGGYRQAEGDAVFLDTANPQYRRGSGSTRSVTSRVTSMVSPSLYSVDGRSSISRPDDGRSSYYRLDMEQDFVELLRECNPYAGQSDHVRSQSKTAVSSPPYTSNPTIPRPAPSRPRSGIAQMKTRRQLQTAEVRKPIPSYVLYKSFGDGNKVLRVPRTKESTIRFVASQEKLDPETRFLYLKDGENKHAGNKNEFTLAVDAEDLYQAIDCLDILTVFVDSNYLRRA